MPLLFYGTFVEAGEVSSERRLFGSNLKPIETSIFDSYKLNKLGPWSRRKDVANFWWFERRSHTALSWHDGEGIEQTVWLPGLISASSAVAISRSEYGAILPGPTTFRLNNERKAYLYD